MIALMVILVLVAILILVALFNVRIIPQSKAVVIERLGSYHKTWYTGIHIKIPIIDRMSEPISLIEQIVDFPPEPVITKDNVTIQIDTVITYRIIDPKAYKYGVEKPILALESLTATSIRIVFGEFDTAKALASRDKINTRIRELLDESTKSWGIRIYRAEIKSIIPPPEIQESMEKRLRAESESKEAILRAEGEKRSAILVAEGEKEALILKAQAEKQSAILHAEAVREAKIREAEGEAKAIIRLQEATAEGIVKINESKPSNKAVLLKSYEALVKVAEGNATKIIIPSDSQSLTSLSSIDKELK
jgi:regulator of protease activity HflC (stomatin/prohibitin superfamily)